MNFIPDKALYAAVMFARMMIREKQVAPAKAIFRAAEYYEVDQADVAHYVGKVANAVKNSYSRKAQRQSH